MCGMSGIELLVVLAVAVIFVGPEHLPEMFRSAGKLMREVRRMTGDIGQVTREIRSSVNIDDIRNQLKAEMAAERERFRLLSQELEIDALKARKSTTTQSPAARAPALMTGAAVASDATATAAAAADSGAPVAADMPSADVASSAGIMDADPGDAPLPPLPTIRPARHAVEAAAATASPRAASAPAAASNDDSTGDPA